MKLQGRVSPSGTECPKVSAMEQQCHGVLLQNQRHVETDCWVGEAMYVSAPQLDTHCGFEQARGSEALGL